MKFRPCIDVHNGSVKQIVGGSLSDKGVAATARENFVSEYDGGYYARLYKELGLSGGHIIMLNSVDSEYYDANRKQAFAALSEYPDGLQIGGGITAENAEEYLKKGASHVIVTSYVFKDGKISFERLNRLKSEVGREHIVLDLSCRKRDGKYLIVTDRWQCFTEFELNGDNMNMLSEYCDEFLVHAVDNEGKQRGIEPTVAEILGESAPIASTYAGGIGEYADIEKIGILGKGKVDFTVGSALDIFGGKLSLKRLAEWKLGDR
ncbi:MAG: phosphoribosylformimino-5-aminoimidazole carboxamide ribotide isomerase [Oscillospiraceae bacterium]|nr:phosphoribosylformimino-5-aminoimidazole carboxamide ribotide isomerase [Oscillospiraceae bacterium]